MGHRQLRLGQLIAPFGPGSIYTDRRGIPLLVCGLDQWYTRQSLTQGTVPCDDPDEFECFEPRLCELLGVGRLRRPPDHRTLARSASPPPNADLHIPAVRFPTWYRHSKTGRLNRFNLGTQRLDPAPKGGRWIPVRFIAVCEAGHLCDFPWQAWIACDCEDRAQLSLIDRGGSELTSVTVRCENCPDGSPGHRGKSLANTTVRPRVEEGEASAFQRQGIQCPGERPWLGDGADEPCSHPLVGALINQVNLYFPRTVSALYLPDLSPLGQAAANLRVEIEKEPGKLGLAKTLWRMGSSEDAVAIVKAALAKRDIEAEDATVHEALASIYSNTGTGSSSATSPSDPESSLVAFRRVEFNVLRGRVDQPDAVPHLRVIPSVVADMLKLWIAKVSLVERLRETRVLYGFDRLEQSRPQFQGMPDAAMVQLFRRPPTEALERWLPAVEVFGEGLYIELDESSITHWQGTQRDWITTRLDNNFLARLDAVQQVPSPLAAADWKWASRYLLAHSLAHTIINQLVFECGYGTASLRERLYVSADAAAPMAAFLIYTAAGDSEGTLGGLVRLGAPDRLEQVVLRAISRASWCSADPICSENLGGRGSRLANLAACHGCILLPETSCETINHGLDRGMVVGEPGARHHGWMSTLLDATLAPEW